MHFSSVFWSSSFILWAGLALAQAQPEKPGRGDNFRPEGPTEDGNLTPERTIELLKEVLDLQRLSSDLLNASAQGKALETEEPLLATLDDLLKIDPKVTPEDAQKRILEKIERLMGKTESNQKNAVDKMAEVLRKARTPPGKSDPSPKGNENNPDQDGRTHRFQRPSQSALRPYAPERDSDPIEKFSSRGARTGRWGDLPARLRESIINGKRSLDDFPPEFQQLLKEYFQTLTNENRE
jgi:hypothetical protein